MSNLEIHLREKIRTTADAIGRLEAELPSHVNSKGLPSNIMSLRKLHSNLKRELLDATGQ